MHWTTLLAFVGLEIVLCFIPGPAVLSVIGASLTGTWRSGLATAFGILTGNAIYFIVSALGIASVIVASHPAFLAIKWGGAAYLAYLGVRSLFTQEAGESPTLMSPRPRLGNGWVNGTIVQLSNPKALVFFTAILPQFIDPHASVVQQVVALGIAGTIVELGVLSIYVAAAEGVGRRGFNAGGRLLAQRIGGLFLLAVAATVARAS